MIVIVSDICVLLDLERGQCLGPCFRLPGYRFVICDILYRRELASANGAELCNSGLVIEGLVGTEVSAVKALLAAHPHLSLSDAYALILAKSRNWTLLTSEGELASIAEGQKLARLGVLAMLDRLFEAQVMSGSALFDGLTSISTHPRCRLPRQGVQTRLAAFARK